MSKENLSQPYLRLCARYCEEDKAIFTIARIPGDLWLCIRGRWEPSSNEEKMVVEKALREHLGCRKGIVLPDKDAVSPVLSTFTVEQRHLPLPRHDVVFPDPSISVVDRHTLLREECPVLPRTCELVRMGELHYIHKFSNATLTPMNVELDNYYRLRGSPYTHNVVALVRHQHPLISLDDPCPSVQTIAEGFLIPFMGARSTLWLPNEWTMWEKEILAVALIDAIADIDSRGVYLTDLRGPNVLLSRESPGLKVIDLDSQGMSYFLWTKFCKTDRQKAVAVLGATLFEMFCERHPHDTYGAMPSLGVPPAMQQLINACYRAKYESVSHLKQVEDSVLKSIRHRRTSIMDLAKRRESRFSRKAKSYDEWWFGRQDADPSLVWTPTFMDPRRKTLPAATKRIFADMIAKTRRKPPVGPMLEE